jgi:hypothetical protein
MGKSQWLAVAIAAALGTSAAHSEPGSRGRMYVTPFAGYTHLRTDNGKVVDEPETIRFDSLDLDKGIRRINFRRVIALRNGRLTARIVS